MENDHTWDDRLLSRRTEKPSDELWERHIGKSSYDEALEIRIADAKPPDVVLRHNHRPYDMRSVSIRSSGDESKEHKRMSGLFQI
jgi:hypothetical protein